MIERGAGRGGKGEGGVERGREEDRKRSSIRDFLHRRVLLRRLRPVPRRNIGQVANIARDVGQAVKNVRNIGSTVNEISGGRIGSSPFGQKMQEITNKVESGANFIANNEGRAQGLVNDISRKINA